MNQLKKQKKSQEKKEETADSSETKESECCLSNPMSFIFSTEQISNDSVFMQGIPPVVPTALWVPAPYVYFNSTPIHQATLVFHPTQYSSTSKDVKENN